jgi:hypothetical protein
LQKESLVLYNEKLQEDSMKAKASKTIVVTGDFTIDWNIARIRRDDISGNSWNPNDLTRA